MAATIALLQFAAAQLAAFCMTAFGPPPIVKGIETLVFGTILLDKFVQAEPFLKLRLITWHGFSPYASNTYTVIMYSIEMLSNSGNQEYVCLPVLTQKKGELLRKEGAEFLRFREGFKKLSKCADRYKHPFSQTP